MHATLFPFFCFASTFEPQAQATSPTFTHVYAALVAVVNTKLPSLGKLILSRLVLQFRKRYRLNDKLTCLNTARFIAHLINQQVAHEILALEVLALLLEHATDDRCVDARVRAWTCVCLCACVCVLSVKFAGTLVVRFQATHSLHVWCGVVWRGAFLLVDSIEVAVAFLKEVGQYLNDVAPRGLNSTFDNLRDVLHQGKVRVPLCEPASMRVCLCACARVCLCVFVCVCVCFGPFAMPEHMLLVSTANEPTPPSSSSYPSFSPLHSLTLSSCPHLKPRAVRHHRFRSARST